jgi:hypothetical protein
MPMNQEPAQTGEQLFLGGLSNEPVRDAAKRPARPVRQVSSQKSRWRHRLEVRPCTRNLKMSPAKCSELLQEILKVSRSKMRLNVPQQYWLSAHLNRHPPGTGLSRNVR